MRTDRGGEFNSIEFGDFCKAQGIKRQLTAAYTPQQNGVAERKNRTIMNAVRSMLSERQVPKQFWSEAAKWSVHIQNRSPTAALEDKTPEEAWSGTKPRVDYFRVFGCIAHVHVPDQRRTKLDDKSKKCVFVGVSDESKAWRLYDPATKKIIVSKDVIFEEEKGWEWNQFEEDTKKDTLECEDEAEQHEEEGGAGSSEVIEHVSSPPASPMARTSPQMATQMVRASPQPITRVSNRERKAPTYLADYEVGDGAIEGEEDLEALMMMLMAAEKDQTRFEDAEKQNIWREAMIKEIELIEKNQTWELTVLPKGVKPIGVKWVYKTKLNEDGKIEKYKARLVAKGYAQSYGIESIDYTEVFAPVARLDMVRTILAVSAQSSWDVFQLDVKSAFLHGELKEDVYVSQPEGFIIKEEEQRSIN